MIKIFLLAFAVTLSFHIEPASSATPILTCGETAADGVLTADLDCSGAPGFAVYVPDGGSLDLAGFTLTGTADFSLHYSTEKLSGGVRCLGSCTIVGNGGTIAAPADGPSLVWWSFGVFSDPNARRTTVTVSDATFTGWRSAGVQGVTLKISDSTFTGNYMGVLGRKKSTIDGCTFTGQTGDAVHSAGITIANSTITGNWGGLYGLRRMRLVNSTVEGNENYGFEGEKLIAESSTFAENCTNPAWTPCADLMAIYSRRPRVSGSSCESSLRDRDGQTWGVCSLD